jgi:hypothetical protein
VDFRDDISLRGANAMRFYLVARTDEDYVVGVRRTLKSPEVSTAFQIFRILFFGLMVALSLILSPLLGSIMSEGDTHLGRGYSVMDGIAAGWTLCFGVYFTLHGIRALRGPRMERTMISFYDDLTRKECAVRQSSGCDEQ